MRALVADGVAVVILGIYGTEICPIMEGMGLPTVWLDLSVALVASYAAWIALDRIWVRKAPPTGQPRRVYIATIGRYLVTGAVLTVANMAVLGIPQVSGVKLTVGYLALGHFVGAELMLARQRAQIAEATDRGQSGFVAIDRPGSFSTRASWFAFASVGLVFGVLALILMRDVDIASEPSQLASMGRSMVIEIATVGVVAILLVARLVWSFGRNVRALFASETGVLEAVGRGELDARVPVLSDDEFGVIASHTNHMIDGLCERRQMREVLGKIVSPAIARSLLDEGGAMLGGSRRCVTVLFSDIRDFTAWSEGTEPEVLVRDLNAYFTAMVEIVHREGGVVDKFIGDGLMAVFGLEDVDDASEAATRAARAMVAAAGALDDQVTRPIRIGVGVHRGDVVAGNIGSPDRLEFTFIGDAVNTAARIESLTRKVAADVLISRVVLDGLAVPSRDAWVSQGSHALKGRREAIEVLSPA
ncbi:MAG: adenylate/guanylate cyclase domain-containing protein [Sandaracinaceae bacterium]|nr:adenylate/guanylate cyclase domain-containing protein [Sandaracinaceae bacterium]